MVIGREAGSQNLSSLSGAWINKVRYSYQVGGQEFFGSRLFPQPFHEPAPSDATQPSDTIVALRNRFPPGRAVEAHYDPKDPARSFLLYRSVGGKSLQLWLGIALTALGLTLVFIGIKH